MTLLILITFLIRSENNVISMREEYINQYKDLAIIEMKRARVPASIKLAQAILESQAGRSDFAQRSNNHFGIKCKTYWKGQTFYQKDDDRDLSGTLIESCFRSYNSVIESYVDHSNFLSKSSNYRDLFRLDITDYKSWAQGLQQSGYATDEDYGKKLISIIESHGLSRFDRM